MPEKKEGKSGGALGQFCAGGLAGAVARTAVAPMERVKIIYQVSKGTGGYMEIPRTVYREAGGGMAGVAAFWRGNTVAVVRAFPYLGIQLASTDAYKASLRRQGLASEAQVSFLGGAAGGITAVATMYPADVVRARMALLLAQGRASASALETLRGAWAEGGFSVLFAGAPISCFGGALYCGVKFLLYDKTKELEANVLSQDHWLRWPLRLLGGGFGGIVATVAAYPIDVLRRRMQTGDAATRERYAGFKGLTTILREEGLRRGLYRGLTLNFAKTVPNSAIYLVLYDAFKPWLFSSKN